MASQRSWWVLVSLRMRRPLRTTKLNPMCTRARTDRAHPQLLAEGQVWRP
jgi:hypothetical protein